MVFTDFSAHFVWHDIFVCRCRNRSGVGAIDNPDRFEQPFDQYYIAEDREKILTYDILMVSSKNVYF